MTIQSKLDDLITAQQALAAKFREEAQELFKEVTKEFFETNPGITAIKWSQYTPYFNDGEECIFSVNQPCFTNAPDDELENVTAYGDYDGEAEGVWATDSINYVLTSGREWHAETADAIRKSGGIDIASTDSFSSMLQSHEMQDVMQAMFDNHVVVTATRNGFDVEEYDHE
jgi:hypothetical protein